MESFQKYKVESRRALKSDILVIYVKLLWFFGDIRLKKIKMNAVIICLKTFQHMPIHSDSKL